MPREGREEAAGGRATDSQQATRGRAKGGRPRHAERTGNGAGRTHPVNGRESGRTDKEPETPQSCGGPTVRIDDAPISWSYGTGAGASPFPTSGFLIGRKLGLL